ncbi:MAG: large repetitive protein [Acidimicrobiaceae bacterium]
MAEAAEGPVRIDADDAHLVTMAQDGDRGAFEELFRRHAHPAWRLALAVGGNAAAAEAAVANGFTNAFRHLNARTTSVATPFRLLAVRATFEAASVEARRTPTADAAAPNAVAAAFRRLPERWRAALWLADVEGGAPAQIAPLLGLSPDAAASLVRKAEVGLRERLLSAAPTVATTPDLRTSLRPLVTSLPAGLRSVTVERWAAWRAEREAARGHGLAFVLPRGPLTERVVGIAAATILALGVIGALTQSGSKQPSRAPLLAAPASEAAPAAPAAAKAAPVAPARPTAAASYVSNAPRRTAAASTGQSVAAEVARSASGTPAAQAASPAAAQSPGPGATPPPSGGDPAATAPPSTGPGVSGGTTVGGQPVSAGAGAGGGGVQAGPIVVGSPPPADQAPGITVDTGILPPVQIGL